MWRTESEERRVQVRLQAYRFELRPERKQRHQMRGFAGSCRFVFNRALALQKELFEPSGAPASYADLCALFRPRIIVKDSKFEEVDCVDFQQLATSLKSTPSLAELQRADDERNRRRPASELALAGRILAELPEHFIQVLPKSSLLPNVPSR